MEENNSKPGLNRNIKLKFILLIIFISLLIFSVKYLNLSDYLNPEMVRSEIGRFGALAPLIFILAYIIATIAFIPGTFLTIASGIIFGTFFGTIYTIIGATIGATITFFISRGLGKGFVEQTLNRKFQKLDGYNSKIEKHGFGVNLFLRVVPIFPFNGLNYALGLTKIKPTTYIISTMLGIIPGSFVLAYFGSSLAELDVMNIILSTLLFLLLILIYPIYKRLKRKKKTTNL